MYNYVCMGLVSLGLRGAVFDSRRAVPCNC